VDPIPLKKGAYGMKRCLKITITGSFYETIAEDFIKKNAQKIGLEGTVSIQMPSSITIMACGEQDLLEDFLDLLHKGTTKATFESIDIAPFLKERDYRGVFRIIE